MAFYFMDFYHNTNEMVKEEKTLSALFIFFSSLFSTLFFAINVFSKLTLSFFDALSHTIIKVLRAIGVLCLVVLGFGVCADYGSETKIGSIILILVISALVVLLFRLLIKGFVYAVSTIVLLISKFVRKVFEKIVLISEKKFEKSLNFIDEGLDG